MSLHTRRALGRRRPFNALRYLFGVTANEYGYNNEKRVVAAFTTDCPPQMCPWWIRETRLSTPEENKRGIDIVFKTDLGDVFLQLRGSRTGRTHFQIKQDAGKVSTDIKIAIVHPSYTPKLIRQILVPIVAEARRALRTPFPRP